MKWTESAEEEMDYSEEAVDDDQDIAFETKSTKPSYYED